jgi:uncharacterized OB-fold protein
MTTQRPAPAPRGEEQVFYAGLAEGELRYQHCADCQANVFPLRTLCHRCGGVDLTLRTASGKGQIYSFTTHYRASHPFFKERVPYTVVLVELAEGFRVLGGTQLGEPEVQVGAAVVARFERVDDELTVLDFVADEVAA